MKPFPQLDEIKQGDKLRADGGFDCIAEGAVVEVQADDGGLFVPCATGRHYLEGQLGYTDETEGQCVGLYRADS